jgi:hypothetical protein
LKLEGFRLLASLSLKKNMKNNTENIDIKILMRYLEGNGSDEDKDIVNQWFTNTD